MTFNRRICTFTNAPISLVDYASVQITFAKLDKNGRVIKGDPLIYNCCKDLRKRGDVDALLTMKLENDSMQ